MTVLGCHPNAKIKNIGIKYFLLLSILCKNEYSTETLLVINLFFSKKKYNKTAKV